MKMISKLKKNNGSTLTLVLFMLFMLSVTAIAVITLTGSELSMSVMTSDRSKALLAAKAGAENAAQVIDTAVAQAQENARLKASDAIQREIDNYKGLNNGQIKPIPDGTLFSTIIDNYSTPGEIKIINEKKWNEIYENEYKYQFDEEIKNVTLKLSGEITANGSFSYKDVIKNPSHSMVKRALDSKDYCPITSVSLVSDGEYTSPSRGSTYKRSISAEFSLLTAPKGDDIPVTYGKLTKVRINKDVKPTILDNKALIAGKNIISVDGTVNIINGDVVCLGTVPKKPYSTETNYDADSYTFGGIMAGMTCGTAPYTNTWESSVQSGLISCTAALGYTNPNYFADSKFFSINHFGSFIFNGNLGTLGYLHALYGTKGSSSNITVDGNTFATGVKVESEANYSQFNLNNVYTYDDLRIDGNNSTVDIGVASNEKELVGLSDGKSGAANSTVIVAGDSNLNIYGSVYVGGSTVYNEYINNEDYSLDKGKPYISGMSIQKSDSRPAAAFQLYDQKAEGGLFPNNTFYFYDNDDDRDKIPDKSDYEELNEENHKLKKSKYKFNDSEDVNMMEGNVTSLGIMQKAMHLKYIWDEFWKKDIGYSSYFNTGDIKITTTPGGKIKGFCYGGVDANDTIYGPYNGFVNPNNPASNGINQDYINKVIDAKKKYASSMDLFLYTSDGITDDEFQKKFSEAFKTPDPTKNTKNLSDGIYKQALLSGGKSEFFSSFPSSDTFMYYNHGNVVLTNTTVNGNNISGKGIIYSTGDIYVKADTNNFKGILIAEGNIVFLGNAHIEYNENVVDDLLMEDPQIGRFFKHTVSDVIMNDPNAIVQTVKKKNVKNIKIISWKEIKN